MLIIIFISSFVIFTLETTVVIAQIQEANAHNARYALGLETYEVMILLPNETKTRYQGANFGEHDYSLTKYTLPISDAVPPKWDIRVNGPGKLTEVKQQGACASSWIFASIAAVENRLSIKDEKLTALSEQQMVDCGQPSSGCMGGWVINAFNYIKNKGLASNESYHYQGKYVFCKEKTVARPYNISGFVQMQTDPTMIKTMIMERGACVMCVDSSRWFNYQRGMFSHEGVTDENKNCNHLVALVGWGTQESSGRPYWLFKNSWGKSWGEDGYIRAAADRYGGCFMNLVFCPII